MDTWLSRRCRVCSMRLFWYCPARKGTAYSLSLQSVRMCSAVLLYPGRLQNPHSAQTRKGKLRIHGSIWCTRHTEEVHHTEQCQMTSALLRVSQSAPVSVGSVTNTSNVCRAHDSPLYQAKAAAQKPQGGCTTYPQRFCIPHLQLRNPEGIAPDKSMRLRLTQSLR